MLTHHKPGHVTAPQITLYKPAAVSFARHRKPNRRSLGWHAHTLVGEVLCDAGEWLMRHR